MKIKVLILCSTSLIAVFVTFFAIKPVPQNIAYHQFADTRVILGMPNAFDVLSNIPFVIVGLAGIIVTGKLLKKNRSDATDFRINNFTALSGSQSIFHTFPRPCEINYLKICIIQYLIFFIGVFLTGLGSYYYHYDPSNSTLVWDRLPMTIAFAGLFCSIVSELISPEASAILLFPLLIVGTGSVFYWDWTEKQGHGDLRLYALVQYLPMILIPMMLFMYKLPANYLFYIAGLMLFYLIGKIFEYFDQEVFELLQVISGHTLKHLFSATGIYCVLRMLKIRNSSGNKWH